MKKESVIFGREMKAFNIDVDVIEPSDDILTPLEEAIMKMREVYLINSLEVVLNNNLIETREKLTNYRTILGCKISYDNLPKEVSFIVRENEKPSYEELEKRMVDCTKYLKSIENHDFSSKIPILILNGDMNEVKKYLDRKIEIYKEDELEFTDEINCLKNILKNKGDE